MCEWDGKKKREKKPRDPVHHMRAPGEMFHRPDGMEIAKLERRADPTPLTSDTGFDRSLCQVRLAQQAINNSSLFLQIRASLYPAFLTELPRLCS